MQLGWPPKRGSNEAIDSARISDLPCYTESQGNVVARVTAAGVYGSGRLFVNVDPVINEPNCPQSRFDVQPDHPEIEAWLAIAMAAMTSGMPAKIVTDGCYGGYPTIGNTTASYFYIKTQSSRVGEHHCVRAGPNPKSS